MVTTHETLSRQLAEWCAGLTADAIPRAVRDLIPLRVMDTLGLIIVGAETKAGVATRAYALDQGGVARSTLIHGGAKVPPAMAALVHGTCAHCRDFDDTFMDSVVHPGSVVVSTALAVGEACEATHDDFIAAIAAGYEIAARLGAVAGRRFHAHALHATGVIGPIAAAATAGRLLRLNGEQIAWAIGLAASMSGGLMAFIVDGGWSKWLHGGWAAHGGIVAADLAARGFVGPAHSLDGGHDLYTALLRDEPIDRAPITEALGVDWRGAAAEFKYYPCAHVIQPYIDAVLSIVIEHDLRPDDVASVECAIAPWASAIVCEPREAKLRFDTELEAIASLPYQLAVAITERGVGLAALGEPMRSRSDLKRLATRIQHRNDPSLGRNFDGVVTMQTTSGKALGRRASTPGLNPGRLADKYRAGVGALQGKKIADAQVHRLLADSGWRTAAAILGSV
ncbi:MAG: MmgE/PrpD family protein [Burkholderiales bacterium]